MEVSYAIEGASQKISDERNSSSIRFRQGGVIPDASLTRQRQIYPLLRYPWRDVQQTLGALAEVTPKAEPVHVAYVNPETGRECLPTLGFSALMLRPGEELRPPRRSSAAVFHVVEGAGTAVTDGVSLRFSAADTLAAPTHAEVHLANASGKAPTFLFMVDDAPLQRKPGIYEVFG